jgi:hypothetical protein
LEGGPPRFPPGSTCPVVLRDTLGPAQVSRTGLSPSVDELSRTFRYLHWSHVGALQPREDESSRFGLFPVRSPLLGESRLISFPPATEMFHFTGLASIRLCIQRRMDGRTVAGFPIRTPPDQRSLSTSPKLFAASHVLHRLCTPRHPPSALSSLTIRNRWRPGFDASRMEACLSRIDGACAIESHSTSSSSIVRERIGPFETGSDVELIGLEPTTSGLQSPRSPN